MVVRLKGRKNGNFLFLILMSSGAILRYAQGRVEVQAKDLLF
jgi:hypothetical protein